MIDCSESIYEARPNFIQPLRLQMKPHLEALNMHFDILADTNVPMIVKEAIGYPSTHRTEEVWDTSPRIHPLDCMQRFNASLKTISLYTLMVPKTKVT